jgi:hypothetical protein
MLRVRTNVDGAIVITPEITLPAVYLDYCVIVELAKDAQQGERVRDVLLRKGGTLYLSWAHLVELFGLGVGPTFTQIRNYLESFGRSFVIIECIPQIVIDREARWKSGSQHAAIDEEFLKELVKAGEGRTDVDVTTLLDMMARDAVLLPKYKEMHKTQKDGIKGLFDTARRDFREVPDARKRLKGAVYEPVLGMPATKYLYDELTRTCIVTNDQFNPSDTFDFFHTIVSVAYCDFVVLDQKWTRRCRELPRLPPPPGAAQVFSIVERDQFVGALEGWTPPTDGLERIPPSIKWPRRWLWSMAPVMATGLLFLFGWLFRCRRRG